MKKNILHITYHVLVIIASAGIALSLPAFFEYLSQKLLVYWAFIEHEELFITSLEIVVAVSLIVLVNVVVRIWWNRGLSLSAKRAGLVAVAPADSFLAGRRMKKTKETQGFGRSIMLIGSTGFRTFTDPGGDLHQVLKNCRDAKIMLLDPLKEGVITRAKSLADPDSAPERFREQIVQSIDFLKGLKAMQKNIRLKLYPQVPHVKLAIFGDYLFLQHYPAGLHVRQVPEYLLKHDQQTGLFNLFYQYFVDRWLDPGIPEYDLENDELVYRDKVGNELRREKFNEIVMEA